MNRFLRSALVALVAACTLAGANIQPASAAMAGDALEKPDIYLKLDVPALWNLVVGPIEKLGTLPAIKQDATLGPQFNMLVTAITTEVTRPFQSFGLDPLHDLTTVTFSAKLAPNAVQALVVVRGSFGKSRLGDLLGSAKDRVETVSGKELHIAEEANLGVGATIRPAYYMTATEWVLGDETSVRAAAVAKNLAAGKVAGPVAAVAVSKPALIISADFAALRGSFVGPLVMMDRDAKTILEMFDDFGIGVSEKELKFSLSVPNEKLGNAGVDIANGINEWLKTLPSWVKGAGMVVLGVHGLIPEEFPDEIQGLFSERKLYFQLIDSLAALVKASGSASYKAGRFEWKIQGTVGSALVVSMLAGVALWSTVARSESAPYYPDPSQYDDGGTDGGQPMEPDRAPVMEPESEPQDSMERNLEDGI